MSDPSRMRVLVVDDHEVFRAEAKAMLESAGYQIADEAINASEAIDKTESLHPDVVLLDVQLPDHDGFWVADQLAQNTDAPVVVLVSSRSATDYGRRLRNAPAAGFIQKAELSRSQLERIVGPAEQPTG
jgi:DNA-binding NarL/FixJ family response regulator